MKTAHKTHPKLLAIVMLFAFLFQPLALCLPTQAEASVTGVGYNGSYQTSLGDTANSSIGLQSFAAGYNVSSAGNYAVAMGSNASAAADNSFAFGGTVASGATNGIAIGQGSSVTGSNSVALGDGATATEASVVSVGNGTTNRRIVNVAEGTADNDSATLGQLKKYSTITVAGTGGKSMNSSTGITLEAGSGVTLAAGTANNITISATGGGSVDFAVAKGVTGNDSPTATQDGALGIGYNATASGQYSTAIGFGANASGEHAVALGGTVASAATNGVAIGQGSSVTGSNSVALGAGSIASEAYEVSVGSSSQTRKISNVTAVTLAENGTYAATTGQLYTETRMPEAGKYYGKEERITAAIGNVDTQVKLNADAISAIHGSEAMNSTITKDKVDKYETYVTGTGLNASDKVISNVRPEVLENGGKNAATTGQVYEEQEARKSEDTALSNRIGTVAADKNYIKSANSVSDNLVALDTVIGAQQSGSYIGKAATNTVYSDLTALDTAIGNMQFTYPTDHATAKGYVTNGSTVTAAIDALNSNAVKNIAVGTDGKITLTQVDGTTDIVSNAIHDYRVTSGTYDAASKKITLGLTDNYSTATQSVEITGIDTRNVIKADGTDTKALYGGGQSEFTGADTVSTGAKNIVTSVSGTDGNTSIAIGLADNVSIKNLTASEEVKGATLNATTSLAVANGTVKADSTGITVGGTTGATLTSTQLAIGTNTKVTDGNVSVGSGVSLNSTDGLTVASGYSFNKTAVQVGTGTNLTNTKLTVGAASLTGTELNVSGSTLSDTQLKVGASTLTGTELNVSGTVLNTSGVATSAVKVGTNTTIADGNITVGADYSFDKTNGLKVGTGTTITSGNIALGGVSLNSTNGLKVADNYTFNTSGLQVGANTNLTASQLTVGGNAYITSSGINANSKPISNVVAQTLAENGTYAATTGQLYTEQEARKAATTVTAASVQEDRYAANSAVTAAVTALDTAIGDMSGFGTQNYAKSTTSVAANLTALDTQAKANADNIDTLQSYFTDGVANEAAKATSDGQGRNIASTYAEKATTLAGYGITDAYTKSETYSKAQVDEKIGSGGNRGVAYTDDTNEEVKFTGLEGTKLSNVKKGTISAESMDAVNGSQLYAEQQERITAVSEEATARTNADSTLQSNIETETTRATTEEGKLSTRIGTLDSNGNYIKKADSVSVNLKALDTQAKVNADAIDTINTSAVMQSGIDATKVGKYETYVTSAGLSANNSAISNVAAQDLAENGTYAATTGQLYAEQKARISAVETLQTNINNEATARVNATVTQGAVSGDGNYAIMLKNAAGTAVATVDLSTLKTAQGNTLDSYFENGIAKQATKDAAGNVIADTYATKTEVSDTYATKTTVSAIDTRVGTAETNITALQNNFEADGTTAKKATTATTADSATKATQDGNGKVIADTYQTKLSTEQLAAANSGITSEKVGSYNTHVANGDIHVTADEKTAWNAYDARITTNATAITNITDGTTVVGNATNATNDGAGKNIAATYATKATVNGTYNAASYADNTLTLTKVDGTTDEVTITSGGAGSDTLAVHYDKDGETRQNSITLQGVATGDKVAISNVAAQTLAENGTYAATTGQLYAEQQARKTAVTGATLKSVTLGADKKTVTVAENTESQSVDLSGLETSQGANNATAIQTINDSAVMNSGITAEKVEAYDGYATAIAGKADKADTLAGYGIKDAYTMKQVDEMIGSGGKLAVAYTDETKTAIKLSGEGGTTISNVKKADLAENGTYAATTGQLYAEQQERIAAAVTQGAVAGEGGDRLTLKNAQGKEIANINLSGLKTEQSNTNTTAIQKINDSAVMKSGITADKVGSYDSHVANGDIHVTAEQKTAWSNKAETSYVDEKANTAEQTSKSYTDTQINTEVTNRNTAITNAVAAEATARDTAISTAVSGKADTSYVNASTSVKVNSGSNINTGNGIVLKQGANIELTTNGNEITITSVGGSDTDAVHYEKSGATKTNNIVLEGQNAGDKVTIKNVAAGTADTDAANYGQIKGTYTDATYADNKLTLTKVDGTTTELIIEAGGGAIAGGDMPEGSVVAQAEGTGVATGYNSVAADKAVASGFNSTATKEGATAIGFSNSVEGEKSTAVGYGNVVKGTGSGAFGDPNIVSGSGSYAIGNDNEIAGNNNFVLGNNVKMTNSEISNSVALGNGSTVTESNVVSVGNENRGGQRRIVNVADGIYATDAATVRQVAAVDQRVTNMQSQVAANTQETREVGAMSAALAGLHYVEPSGEGDDKFTGAVSYGGYRGENAAALGVAYKPSPNLMVSASTSVGNSQNMYNAGVGFKFGKGKTVNRAAMAKQIKYLGEENSKLKAENAEQNVKIEQQGKENAALRSELDELKAAVKELRKLMKSSY